MVVHQMWNYVCLFVFYVEGGCEFDNFMYEGCISMA